MNINCSNKDYVINELLKEDRNKLYNAQIVFANFSNRNELNDKEKSQIEEELLSNRKKYELIENNFENIASAIKKMYHGVNILSIWNGYLIDYTMTLDMMKQNISKYFSKLKNDGILISHTEFEKLDKNKWHYTPNNFTRIFGIDYLKQIFFLNEKDYVVPKYILVAPENENIKVEIWFSPYLPTLNTTNCKIYSEKIIGIPDAHNGRHKERLVKYGFKDYSDPGNIIKMKDRYYVVDTELKSFDFDNIESILSQLPGGQGLVNIMAIMFRRFKLCNPTGNSYEFNLLRFEQTGGMDFYKIYKTHKEKYKYL